MIEPHSCGLLPAGRTGRQVRLKFGPLDVVQLSTDIRGRQHEESIVIDHRPASCVSARSSRSLIRDRLRYVSVAFGVRPIA